MSDEAGKLELQFCRLVCTGALDEAAALLEQHTDLLTRSVHCAATWGETQALSLQLEQEPARAHAILAERWTPLLLLSLSHCARPKAARADEVVRCARLLLEHQADPNASVPDGEIPGRRLTALAAAAGIVGNRALCAALLEAGAPANDGAALFVAAAEEHWECVSELLAHGGDLNRTDSERRATPLHWILDWRYKRSALDRLLREGADPNTPAGATEETPLHVAVRRRRINAVTALVEAGAEINAQTSGGMTAYRHAVRRNFSEVQKKLAELGADTQTIAGDDIAVALYDGRVDDARALLESHPNAVPSDVPEEARLIADMAGGGRTQAVQVLLDSGVDIAARGLDGGTPLHQAAWFGQPEVAQLLVERGAPLAIRGDEHDCTPLGWVAHGSKFSGGAEERSDAYVAVAEILLNAGAPFPQAHEQHDHVQFSQASAPVAAVLQRFGWIHHSKADGHT